MLDLAQAFQAQAERVGASVRRTAPGGVVALATEILRAGACRTVGLAADVPEPAGMARALAEAGLSVLAPAALSPIRRADGGMSVARLGVAETGSVLLASGPEDRRVELCVDVHLVVLATARLVPTLDEAFVAIREASARPPAYATLVSGPSRSADIERQLTVGVHGPRAVHVLLVDHQS